MANYCRAVIKSPRGTGGISNMKKRECEEVRKEEKDI